MSNLVTAVNLVGLFKDLLDVSTNAFGALLARTRHTFLPSVLSTLADLEHLAHQTYWKGVAVLLDPGVLHFDSFAKYAVAFFRISRSISAR